MKRFLPLFIIALVSSSGYAASETLTLEAFLKEVNQNSLSLKVNSAEANAAEAKSVGVDIPPPMAAITQMRDQSGSANGFEISQTIPFPTKLTSNHSARKFEAQASKAMLQAAKSEILAQARFLYASLWLSQQRIDSLKEKKSAIAEHLKLSTASARSDSSLRIHTLKAESDLDLLENEILEAEQMVREKQIQLAEISGKDPSSFKPILSEPPLAAIPTNADLARPVQLEAKQLNLEKLKAMESEAKSSWLPDFNLRYREMGGTTMTPRFSETMLGVSLPFVFFWEPNAASKSATAERFKGEVEFTQARLRIESKKASLLSKAESLKKQLEQINGKLLPRAEKRMRLVHNLAPRDMESLQDHREAMESFPDLKLKALDLRERFEETVAELSSFTARNEP
jgi:outer membrane protein TolC